MANAIVLTNAMNNERKHVELESNAHNGQCVICNLMAKSGNADAYRMGTGKGKTRIPVFNQQRGVHLCDYHAENVYNCLLAYSTEFMTTAGTPNDKMTTICFELECMSPDHTAICQLAQYGFLATSDCTVSAEFKIPICYSLSPVTKWLNGIEWLLNNNHMIIDSNCGTHIHVSHYDRVNEDGLPHVAFDYRTLGNKEIYEKLFFPACEYIGSLSREKRIEYFGAGFRDYAQNPVNHSCYNYCGYHSTIFNVQHSYSLEFRLPRFKTAQQFRKNIVTMQKVNAEIVYFKAGEQTVEKAGEKIAEIFKKDYPV